MSNLLEELRSYKQPKRRESLSADRVRAIREGLGLSKPKFARALGVSTMTIYRWESPEGPPPGPFHFRRLLEIEAALRAEANGHG
jgi:DNA-binding transcriptional regulator YiaG